MESTVEETPELIAVHNMTVKELLRALSLGGLTMPSIAVLKAKQGYLNDTPKMVYRSTKFWQQTNCIRKMRNIIGLL